MYSKFFIAFKLKVLQVEELKKELATERAQVQQLLKLVSNWTERILKYRSHPISIITTVSECFGFFLEQGT